MLKKIMAASVMLSFFACTSNGGGEEPSNSSSSGGGSATTDSSSSGVEVSSSSNGPVQITIAGLNGDAKSEMFGTYTYVFTLKDSKNEDLTPFWDVENGCSIEKQETKPASTCQLDITNAILQHNLTNQYSKLHYQAKYSRVNSLTRANTLYKWNLTGNGDEATLGLNVDSLEKKDIAEMGITALNNIATFEYNYTGGAHEFRIVSKKDADFWYYEVQASTAEINEIPFPEDAYQTITIPISDLKGMGDYDGVPFDISKAAKFLWAVKYSAANDKNNKGSLGVYGLKAELKP